MYDALVGGATWLSGVLDSSSSLVLQSCGHETIERLTIIYLYSRDQLIVLDVACLQQRTAWPREKRLRIN